MSVAEHTYLLVASSCHYPITAGDSDSDSVCSVTVNAVWQLFVCISVPDVLMLM